MGGVRVLVGMIVALIQWGVSGDGTSSGSGPPPPASPPKYAIPGQQASGHADLATGGSGESRVEGLTWVYTTPEKWYSQHDLCIIKNWHLSSNMTLPALARAKCKLEVEKEEWSGRLFVGYGNSYKATCSPPLTDRPQYMQALVGFNDPDSPHLVEAMRSLQLLNRTLVFFGDSMMRQNYIAFLAELKRLDKHHIDIDRWASVKKMANKTTLPRVVNVFQRSDDDLEGGGATVWLSHHSHSSPSGSHRPMAVYYVSCHRLEQGQFAKAMQLVSTIASKSKGVVLLANLGIHYNDRSQAFKAMNVILPELSSFAGGGSGGGKGAKHNIVLWRETSAQHFEFRSQGYFDHVAANGRKERHCTPHGMIKPIDRNDEIDWRNEDVKTILGVNQISNLHYVPFYAATLPLHAMHPEKDKIPKYTPGYVSGSTDNIAKLDSQEYSAFASTVPIDCTHFCHLPTLWQPIWRALADVAKSELNVALGALGAKEVDAAMGSSPASAPSLLSGQQHSKKPSHNGNNGKAERGNSSSEKPATDKSSKPPRVSHEKDKIQYLRLSGSNRTVPVGPNFVLHVVHPAGAVVRNGIDIDKAAIIMKLPTNSNISSIRSVAIDDDGFQIIRYEVRNKQGQVEGWISSNVRDKDHNLSVEILPFCIQCIERGDGGRLLV